MDVDEERDDDGDTTPQITLRFVLGCASLARDRIASDLRSWQRVASREAASATGSPRWHRVVGLSVRAPMHLRSAVARGRGSCVRVASRLAPWWRPIQRSALGRAITDAARDLRAAWRAELVMAEHVGRIEEARGRSLARVGLRAMSERVFDRLATNPDVQSLVATQSASVTSTALDELRTQLADADETVSAAFHRWLDDPRAQIAALRRRAARGA